MQHEIEHDIELYENILREIDDHWEQWQNEEYERELMSIEPSDSQTIYCFCPVCQMNLLELKENIISCSCGLRFALIFELLTNF